jgi:glyoxylase-like metal-dependent hydrolase (beta-lactamase superfamily II)
LKITENIYVVAGGKWGFGLTHELDCNVFLIDTGSGAILIDAGVNIEPERIVDVIRSHGFGEGDLKKLLLTHYHGDHAGGAAFFKERFGCEVYAPAKEADAIAKGDEDATSLSVSKGGLYPSDYVFRKCPVTGLNDGDKISLGGVTLTGYSVPGHSLEDMVYYGKIDDKQCIFTGDSVFAAGQVLIQSLHDVSIYPYRLAIKRPAELEVDSIFPAHGIFCLSNGGDHIKAASAKFEMGLVPPQLFYFA